MKKYGLILIFVNLVIVLFYYNYSIVVKENHLKNGQLILLELSPVDPRSLMQGDYMDLRYNILDGIVVDSMPEKGYCIVEIEEGVGKLLRFQKESNPLDNGEFLLKYRAHDWYASIGSESFFFQEGDAGKYENAKYGGVKVDEKGNSILTGLYDVNKVLIK